MSISLSSARRAAAGAVGATAVAGAMLFGATPAANAAPAAPMPQVVGLQHIAPLPDRGGWGGGGHWGGGHWGGGHGGFGRHGFWGGHRGFGFGHGGFGRGGFWGGHRGFWGGGHRGWWGGQSVVRRTSVIRRGWW